MGRILRRSLLVAGTLILIAVLFVYWLLMTNGGRQSVLNQIVAQLPAGVELTWARAEGTAAGPLTLHDVRFAFPRPLDPSCVPATTNSCVTAEIVVTAREVTLDVVLRSVFRLLRGGRLRLATLRVQQATLTLPERADEPFELPRWPAVLPEIATPLAIQIDDLRINDLRVSRPGEPPIDIDQLRGGLMAADGELHLERLAIDSDRGYFTLHGDYGPGDNYRTDLVATAVLPAAGGRTPARLGLVVRGDLSQTVVALAGRVPEPVRATLVLRNARAGAGDDIGNSDRVRWQLRARAAALDPALLSDSAAPLAKSPLAFTLQAEGAGRAATAQGEVHRGEFQATVLPSRFWLDDQRLRVDSLHVKLPNGKLDANGTVAWAPEFGWELDGRLAGFDPGDLFAGWNGEVNGEFESSGRTRDDGGLEISVEVSDLGGQLRGRPLDGSGHYAMHGGAAADGTPVHEGDIALSLGDSRVEAEARIGQRLDIDARFAPLQLADLLPDASGSLRGTLQVSGSRSAPDIAAKLDGSDLRYNEYSADSVSINGALPWSGGGGAVTVRARNIMAGIALDRLDIETRGAVDDLQLDAHAEGALGSLDVDARLGKRHQRWAGAIGALKLDAERGASWSLKQPAQFSWTTATPGSGIRGSLDELCLASGVGGSLCVNVDWPRGGITLDGQGLPLSLAAAYLPKRDDNQPWLLRGDFELSAGLRPQGDAWVGQARIASASGGLGFSEDIPRELVTYGNLLLTADIRPQAVEATLGAVLNQGGRIDAHITTGTDASAPLDGKITWVTDELTWMELLSPDIVEPTGRLSGSIILGGTRAQPTVGGQAQLTDFSTDIPSLAISLRDGKLESTARPDGSVNITGSVRSTSAAGNPDNTGVLQIDGSLQWQGNDTALKLNLRGTDVLVSDTREVRAIVSPDLAIRYRAGEPLQVTGEVVIPEARVNLEGLTGGPSTSPDVVVLDPIDADDGAGTALAMNVTMIVGDDVQMSGFGFDGSLSGRLQVGVRPGRELIAAGNLRVEGEYSAYGQDLTITRGRLSWSADPIANPLVDLRAEREIGEVTAGIDVSGRAAAPQAEVWSNPASSQSEALAYLTLGRPLSTVSGSERGQLSAASAALSAGGSLLASQLEAKIGIDDAGVMQSRALGGSVFGVGEQISPRLYVGYGVSLLGTGQVLTFLYLLDHGFDIEIESSSEENLGSINWRKEK